MPLLLLLTKTLYTTPRSLADRERDRERERERERVTHTGNTYRNTVCMWWGGLEKQMARRSGREEALL